ncbi:MAG: prepilin-type N-terminal cleavage/methylation domain-containing protein [Gemmatimonadetes bacterium]|jgi:prepilin-type N-terminal cleavage/methylation domain-containing protein|nr:prepilin-type N-terminal cleavage/methylation domain-containing protein [Gemmatimonadota bacterium]
MMSKRKRGFTLVELVVVTVLGGILIASTLQILVTNQRTYTAQNAQIQGTQAMRAALEILSGELREVSPLGGDIIKMTGDSLRVRASRKVGLICHDSVLGNRVWRVMQIGDWFSAGDSVHVFADNDATNADDDWITTTVSSIDTTKTCSSSAAQQITFPSATPFMADSVSAGAEVRSFIHIAYGLMTYNGTQFLGRKISGGAWTPVVGPLSSRGVSFAYLDLNGNSTTTETAVTQIEVTVRTSSDVMDSTGNPVADSVAVRIFLRN